MAGVHVVAQPGSGVTAPDADPRETITDDAGRFRLELPPGRWSLRLSVSGYRDTARAVTVAAGEEPVAVEVTLEPEPVALEDLQVTAERDFTSVVPLPRWKLESVPALVEPDIFRATTQVPGAGQPNDQQSRLHLTGGASDETAVLLDGHPLQSPYHLLGILGAIPPAVLDGVELRMHHLPARQGAKLSGSLNLKTRRPSPGEEVVDASASLLSTHVTAARSGAGPEVLAFGRIAYADAVAPIIAPDLPRLTYHDGLVRVGEELGDGWRTELLGFLSRNEAEAGRIRTFQATEPLGWGENLLGWRLERRGERWGARLRVSSSSGWTRFEGRRTATAPDTGEVRIDMQRDHLSAEAAIEARGEWWRLEAGADYDDRRHAQAWSGLGRGSAVLSPGLPDQHRSVQGLDVLSAFLEGEVARGPVELTVGGRAEGTKAAWWLAPRVQLSVKASDRLTLEAAADRRFQWTELLREPIEYSLPPPEFLLRTPRQVDVAAVGASWEGSGSEAVEARLEVFGKDYGERPLLPGQPALGSVDRHAYGVLARARVPLGSAALEASYAFQRSFRQQGSNTYPVNWDVPHDLSLHARVPGPAGLRLSGAAQLRSGIPYTPRRDPARGGGRVRGAINSARLPVYFRLDVGAGYEWNWGESRWTANLQVLNVTDHENLLEKLPRRGPEVRGTGERKGLPLVPSLGLRVRF